MPRSISERAAQVSRSSMTRARLRRSLNDPEAFEQLTPEERMEQRVVREEIQADTDMDLDPAYSPLLRALNERLGRRRVYGLVFHPEQTLTGEVTYPLTNDEAASLLAELLEGEMDGGGTAVKPPEAWTLERMVEERLLPPTPRIGGGSLPRNAYFARHIVAASYRVLFVREKPEVLKAEATVARRELAPETAAYLKVLAGTDANLISAAQRVP